MRGNTVISKSVFCFTHGWHYSLGASCFTATTPDTLVFKKSTKCGSMKLQVVWNIQSLLNLLVACHLGRLCNTARENKLKKADALTATNWNLITLPITFPHHSVPKPATDRHQLSVWHLSQHRLYWVWNQTRHCYTNISSTSFKLSAVGRQCWIFHSTQL